MNLKNKLARLANEKNEPCVTISLNTHRTHPDNLNDEIVLKNLVKEAENRVIEEFGERESAEVLEKIRNIESKIDINYLLDSLHIFLSKDTEEIVLSIWPADEDAVYVDEHFAIKPLIVEYNRFSDYLILKLTQGATHLYKAHNERVSEEVKNHIFPFGENPHKENSNIQRSDSEFMDTMIREHFRDIDKALVDFIQEENEDLRVVVIADEDNYSKLQQVATKPNIYIGQANINHHEKYEQHLAEQAWEIIQEELKKYRAEAIEEVKEAIGQNKVITDLQEIFQASLDGRADLLIVHRDFKQPVKMIDERTFELGDDPKEQGYIDDITSDIAWKVISNGGNVVITSNDEIKELGDIVLKTRY